MYLSYSAACISFFLTRIYEGQFDNFPTIAYETQLCLHMNSKFWEDWFWCALHASIDGSLVVHQYSNRRHQKIAGSNEKCMQLGEHTLHYKTMGFTTQQSAAFFVELINLQLWPQSDGKDRRILAKNNKRQFRSIFGDENL